ncbi:dTDP-4-dehydrorhamnose reductase [Aequorivita echinoideorum]|uniref:dTDP-4-dehydrorhamnose reductase n=1 Tax=Aequorivita echinoideorum TaxID=1549647 RepID=A0ABS5S6D5_9FLAO|nr:dTDP-4-dehydrorhamnose reductase [Aequorivita echinoideorum]MBT0607947.1 dTDP-4-dehydrorhamnose reductase [Aequorivita echinoideorum]
MSTILVTGAHGQLGSEIRKISTNFAQFNFVFAGRDEMPLENKDAIVSFLEKTKPSCIINAGAYTAVDKAETERELADQVNHIAVGVIAKWCKLNNTKLIHISTDYVFDGNSQIPLDEAAKTAPVNWYGETKLRGEEAILEAMNDAIIIRTAWVYSEYGNNFVKTMLRLLKERDRLTVVNDQIGAPTYALDLAEAILKIVSSGKWETGIFHYSNKGKISWFDFAIAIKELAQLECEVVPVPSSQFPTAAKRPNYSLLDTSKIEKTYGVQIPFWKDSLRKCLFELGVRS